MHRLPFAFWVATACACGEISETFEEPVTPVLSVREESLESVKGSYDGDPTPLPLKGYMAAQCDAREQRILRKRGFSKLRHISVDGWRDIVTIQASPLIADKLLDDVAFETERVFRHMIRIVPDKVRRLLNYHQRSFNMIFIYGAGDGWAGGMTSDNMLCKRNGCQVDGGLFHELGHVFDIQDMTPEIFRDHRASVFAKSDMQVLDRNCERAPAFINKDGTCQYSEFVAERFRDMLFPGIRRKVRSKFPEVYNAMLKYIPEPANHVPFQSSSVYGLSGCPECPGKVPKGAWLDN